MFSLQAKVWGHGFFLEGCAGPCRARLGDTAWQASLAFLRPPSGPAPAPRETQWSPLSSGGEEEGTCCGGMNVPGEPPFSTRVKGARLKTYQLYQTLCVCVCARTVNFQQLCGRTNPQAEILVLLGFQVSELAEGKASLGGGIHLHLRLPGGLRGGEPSANAGGAGDRDSVPGSGGAPGGGGSNPLQKSRLESSMDRGPGGLQSTGSQRAQ